MTRGLGLHIAVELLKILRARLGRIAIATAAMGVALPIVLIGALGDENVSTFPGVIAQLLLPSLTILIGIISMLLAVSSWGDEYEYGTVRTVLSRCPTRWQFVLGKTAALALATAAIVLVALAAEVLVAAVSHLVQVGWESIPEHLTALGRIVLPLAAVWWLAGMVYTGVVALTTVAARSPALGMAAGLGLFLGDFLLSCLGPAGPHVQLGPYSIINNSYGLFSSIMGDRFDVTGGMLFPMAETMTLPDPGRALGTLLLYAAGTLGLAYLLFREQDIL
jgi:ABC-type transport system involved in multi-copper enzyme maturation permease subunit